MAKKNFSSSYQRVQDAKSRSRASVGAARAAGPLPPPPPPPPLPHNLGTPSQPIVISSSASSLPSPPPRYSPEPEKKKLHGSVREAGVCTKLLDIFEKTPLSSLGSSLKVEELKGRLFLYQEDEKKPKMEVTELKEERDHLQERERSCWASAPWRRA
nr:disheveled-associated activator of morphogenesis 1-A-like [Arachis hypogaea]